MKISISRSLIVALTVLMSTHGVASEQLTIVGDITIKTLNGTIYCDSLICPPGSYACHVTKNNDPDDLSKIIRTRKCFAENGAILAQETITEENNFEGSVNINVISGGGDHNIVHPRSRKIEQTEEELKSLQNGTFERNLKESIQNEVRESLLHAFSSL